MGAKPTLLRRKLGWEAHHPFIVRSRRAGIMSSRPCVVATNFERTNRTAAEQADLRRVVGTLTLSQQEVIVHWPPSAAQARRKAHRSPEKTAQVHADARQRIRGCVKQ